MKNIAYLLALASLLLASCSALMPSPTATPMPTETSIPTDTPEPTTTPLPTETATLPPTVTPTETSSLADLTPKETPAKEWHGIKIMPGAITGSGDEGSADSDDDGSYVFSIKTSKAEIEAFYEKELSAADWILLAKSADDNASGLMIFMKDGKNLSVSIIPSDDGFIVMILIQ